MPIYASYLHDAASVYARALIELLEENVTSVRNGTAVLSKIKGRMYESMESSILVLLSCITLVFVCKLRLSQLYCHSSVVTALVVVSVIRVAKNRTCGAM